VVCTGAFLVISAYATFLGPPADEGATGSVAVG
jgi:hypothetical protein